MTRLLIVVLTLCLGVASAHATPTQDEAKRHYEAGLQLHEKKQLDPAIEEFKKAWSLDPQPIYLFAVATLERQRGNCAGAIKVYKQFLKLELSADERQKGETYLERCQKVSPEQPEGEPKQPIVTPQPQVDEGSPWYTDGVGHVLMGAGLVGVGVGVVFFLGSSSDESAATTATTYADYKSFIESAQSKRTIAVIGLIGGSALVVAGIIKYATGGKSATRKAEVTGWIDRSGGGGLMVFGQF